MSNYSISSGTTNVGLTLNSGDNLYVSNGGVANDTTINRYGEVYVSSGGVANNTTVNVGILNVSNGGYASHAVLVGASDRDEGDIYVYRGGMIEDVTVEAYGDFYVRGGTAKDTTISSGGGLWIDGNGGIAKNTTISSGGSLWVDVSNGKLTGKTTILDGGYVYIYSGAIIDFDISELAPGSEARFNNLSAISGWGNASFTLTVSDTQTDGTYALAGGAADFDNIITVQNTSGEELFDLSLGETVTIDGTDYTLALSDGTLSLTIGTGIVISGQVFINQNVFVSAGELYLDTAVSSGGRVHVQSGGKMSSTSVTSGGELFVSGEHPRTARLSQEMAACTCPAAA